MIPAPLRGGCHCGNLALTLATAQDPAALHPRACDCAFCTKHGAGWVSDPDGALAIGVREAAALGDYRQGSGSARFLLCRDCGVLVAVVHEGDGGLRGAVNARCLDAARFGDAVRVSPQQLSREDKIARWGQLWTPATLDVGRDAP
ncbi:MAG TPA: aldehyde-activating protein [Xanthomonadaceae bacterium]|nr:aldehyde-activating protein [Xanthomonadaceae bacterium]